MNSKSRDDNNLDGELPHVSSCLQKRSGYYSDKLINMKDTVGRVTLICYWNQIDNEIL